MLEVLEAGFLSTVQDGGRPGFVHLGVPPAGPCDPWSHAVANLLVGNEPGTAALELTVVGPVLAVRDACVVGLAGADLGGVIRESGERFAPGGARLLRADTTLSFAGGTTGARAYLALPGGIAVPEVLGSRSTCLAGGFGGLDGRPLRPGDRLAPGRPGETAADGRRWPGAFMPDPEVSHRVRVVEGPDADLLAPDALEALLAAEWRVSAASNRMGLRLAGPPLPGAVMSGDRASRGVAFGAIQVPPDGQPIVLLADAPTVGGYPVLAVAATADRRLLGQLRPGDPVRLERVSIAAAQAGLREHRERLLAGARSLAADATWDELWRSARG